MYVVFVRRRLYGDHCVGEHPGSQVELFDPLLDVHGSQEHMRGVRVVDVAEKDVGLCRLRQTAEVQTLILVMVT